MTKCKPLKRLPNGITIAKCDPAPEGSDLFFALDPKHEPQAVIILKRRGRDFIVASVQVKKADAQRQRLGTRLYETAVEFACKKGGRLISDHERSAFAEAFWRKQAAKGRAMCVEPGKGRFYKNPTATLCEEVGQAKCKEMMRTLPEPVDEKWPCRRYGVTEPCAVSSLEGVRRKKAKRRKR